MFHCGGLYINRGRLLREKLCELEAKIAENIKQQAVETEEEEDEDDDSVFAKLKSNKVNKLEKQLKITRDDIVCEQANKYMKRGLVKESVFYTNKDKKETKNSTLSFSDWIKGN
jgi:hypothetical protein